MRKYLCGRIRFNALCLINSIIFCIFSPSAIANSGSISNLEKDPPGTVKGIILTSDNRPGAFVTLIIKGTRKSTTTEEDGTFIIRNLPKGNYELEVSLIGTSPLTESISIISGQETTVKIRLSISARELQEIIITGNRSKIAVLKQSDYIAKIPLKDLENPQVYNVISESLMKEQVVSEMQSALQNVAGGSVQQNPDRSVYIMSRGFETYGLLRDGIPTGQFFDNTDPVNIEKMEVLKGPSETLFGANISSYGGVINRVTKKPYDHFGGEVGYFGGQWDLSRFTLDINTPLNNDKTALLRINAASHQEGSFQDAGLQSSWIVAPSLSLKINDKLSFTLDAENARNNSVPLYESGIGLSNLSATNFRNISIPYNSSLIGNDVRDHIGTTNVFAGATYKISGNWVSKTIYGYDFQAKDAYNLVFLNFNNDSTLNRTIYATRSGRVNATDLQENLTGSIHTGALQHRLLLGLDYYSYKLNYPYAYIAYDSNLNYTRPGTANMSMDLINQDIAATSLSFINENQYTLAAYASDLINFTPALIGMASARIDHFVATGTGAYQQNAVSPKFGLIYQPIKDKISIFVNYLNGFQNVSGSDFYGRAFRPQQANQWEGGVKSELFGGKLSATLSYYNILVKNVLRTDTSHPFFEIQDGTQGSKGFEAELIASPLNGLNITAGYGYNDNEYMKTETYLNGKTPVESPHNSLNAWFSYTFQKGNVKGLLFGLGLNYTSQQFSYFDSQNQIPLPAYTILRATVVFDQRKYSIGVKVNNLTGQKYWNTNGEAQNPAQVTGNLIFKF